MSGIILQPLDERHDVTAVDLPGMSSLMTDHLKRVKDYSMDLNIKPNDASYEVAIVISSYVEFLHVSWLPRKSS